MADEQSGLPRCANCGAEISWRPVVHRGSTYCCGGCAQGGPCYCSYDMATLGWLPVMRIQRPRPNPKKGASLTQGKDDS
jgi:hypothetical protein